ncbi:MAG: hypothetical protein ACXAC7_09265 [Candidatus Hodarchaeales archaeon]|jgi:hypothetical protein
MTWIPLLLTDPSPNLRLLVLKELLNRSEDDPEIQELSKIRDSDTLVIDLFKLQKPNGSWSSGALPGSYHRTNFQVTCDVLKRLGYLGFKSNHPVVQKGVEFLFKQQNKDGSWPLITTRGEADGKGTYSMIPLQTAFPLHILAMCGYVTDSRAEKAYEWLLDKRLPDGAWPTGIAEGVYVSRAGYRKLPNSRWGCRSNTTSALNCLAFHPKYQTSPEAKKALDLLLGCFSFDKNTLGFEVSRMIGVEYSRGYLTYHAKLDQALILDFCWRIGASLEDKRVAELIKFIQNIQGPYGLWEYKNPQASRWITFDLLRSLTRIDETNDWISLEPRIPYQRYPKAKKRF